MGLLGSIHIILGDSWVKENMAEYDVMRKTFLEWCYIQIDAI